MVKGEFNKELEEKMAVAVHDFYRELCKKEGWPVKYDMDYLELPGEIKADNLAAATRIPKVLSSAGLSVVPDDDPGAAITQEALEDNIEVLAKAEHKGWMEQKEQSGWTYGTQRDDGRKIHPALIPYKALSKEDREKDRNAVRNYPTIVRLAGYKITHSNK